MELSMMGRLRFGLATCVAVSALYAAPVMLMNSSFEEGEDGPRGWTASDASCSWRRGAAVAPGARIGVIAV